MMETYSTFHSISQYHITGFHTQESKYYLFNQISSDQSLNIIVSHYPLKGKNKISDPKVK